jgi:hypothetical protein
VEGRVGARLAQGLPRARRLLACDFLSAEDESADAVEARATGAFEVIGKAKIKHTKLNDAIKRAADEQAKAQSRWRMSAGAKMAQDFAGCAAQGISAHRAHREGFGVGAVPGRERETWVAWWCSR